jgi:hypothetical protein
LIFDGERPRAGYFNRYLFDLLWIQLGHQAAGFLLGQRHQKNGRIVNVGHRFARRMLAVKRGGRWRRRHRSATARSSVAAQIGRRGVAT